MSGENMVDLSNVELVHADLRDDPYCVELLQIVQDFVNSKDEGAGVVTRGASKTGRGESGQEGQSVNSDLDNSSRSSGGGGRDGETSRMDKYGDVSRGGGGTGGSGGGGGDDGDPGGGGSGDEDGEDDGGQSDDVTDSEDEIDPLVFENEDFKVWYGGNRNVGLTHQLKVSFDRGTIEESIYKLAFKPHFLHLKLVDIIANIEDALQQLLTRLHSNYGEADLVRICILSPNFHVPHSLQLQALSKLTVKQIVDLLDNVLQSDEELTLLEGFEIHVGVARNPLGAGRRSRGYHFYLSKKCDVHKNRSTVKIVASDNLCFARSMVVAIAKNKLSRALEESGKKSPEYKNASKAYKKIIRRKRAHQRDEASKLQLKAGLSLNQKVSMVDIPRFEKVTSTQVVVFSPNVQNRIIYVGKTDKVEKVYLLYRRNGQNESGHYHPIVSLSGFFKQGFFCPACKTIAKNRQTHSCDGYCNLCLSHDCLRKVGEQSECPDCKRMTRSRKCMTSHKSKGVCDQMARCPECTIVYKRSVQHKCGYSLCPVCDNIVSGTHLCSVRAKEPKNIGFKYMFADFEARFVNDGIHKPNLVIAHWHCEACIDVTFRENPKCSQCGNACEVCRNIVGDKERGHKEREVCMNTPECGVREIKFFGDECGEDFCKFFFNDRFTDYSLFFHNFGGYDSFFILPYICKEGLSLKIIYRGSKVVAARIEGRLNQRLCDSLNFLPMPLSAMPKVFGLKGVMKGTFPHFFNAVENYDVENAPLPPMECYAPDQMKVKSRREFMAWYQEECDKGTKFTFMKALENYCRDDVNILQESCLNFRSNLIELTKKEVVVDIGEGGERNTKIVAVDPLQYNTVASICMSVYRYMFLPETYSLTLKGGQRAIGVLQNDSWKSMTALDDSDAETHAIDPESVCIESSKFMSTPIARMPSCGFGGMDTFSVASIHWLMYISQLENVHIRHALNDSHGEFRIPSPNMNGCQSRVDGWAESTQTVYLYHGCLHHGCCLCYHYPRPVVRDYDSLKDPFPRHPHTGQTMMELFTLTKKYEKYITETLSYNLVTIWECQFKDMIESDENLRQFILDTPLKKRLVPRDALFGGRVNASKLYCDVRGSTNKIAYGDITSLYPTVLKYDTFPVGFPEIILRPDTVDIDQYFGIIYCRVRAPRKLLHPILPIRTSDKKLVFALCQRCAELRSQSECQCHDDVRDLEGTWCTVELHNAVKNGYIVRSVYEVYHFAKSSTELFSGYVNMFLKRKQEASGWPTCDMSESQKEQYISEYLEAEGILLDKDSIEFNSGMRLANKAALNNLWGKFSECQTYRKHEMINSSEKFYSFLTDSTLILKDIHALSENTAQIEYVHKDGHTPESPYVNIFIGIFTTAHARTRLYKEMSRLQNNVCYYDTDSLVYLFDSLDSNAVHPEYGSHLGQWTNELPASEHIVQFVSSGPKSYAYVTSSGSKTIKIKGLTLTYSALQSISFESMKALVLHYVDPEMYPLPEDFEQDGTIAVTYPTKIKRDRISFTIYHEPLTKKFKVTYGKRLLLRDGSFNTIPFGYKL
jgi:hypothetical protein